MSSAGFDNKRSFDVICMGRVAVDLYAEQIGSSLDQAESFRRYLGGSPGNIAVGTARQGLKSAILSCVGSDDMGLYVKNTLIKEGVDISLLEQRPEHLTALVLLGVNPPDRFPLIFYRENCADMQIAKQQCDGAFFSDSKAFLFTGTCLSSTSMNAVTHHAIKLAKHAGTAIIFDIDFRPVLWKLTECGDGESRFALDQQVSAQYKRVLSYCDLIVGTEEEFMIAGGCCDVNDALANVRKLTDAILVLKTGAKGCQIYPGELSDPIVSRSFPVKVLNVLGAGDAFMSGLLSGWLRGESLQTSAEYANACGALVVTRHGCAPAIPNISEMKYFINNYDSARTLVNDAELDLLHRRSVLGRPSEKSLFILAFDHRDQFEKTCQQLNKPLQLVEQFKQHVFQGFLTVNHSNKATALLADPVYASPILKQATDLGVTIGCPIEKAGSLPVSWIDQRNLYEIILTRPSHWFVKVLWYYHPNMDCCQKEIQLARLKELAQVCAALDRKLMIELVAPKSYAKHCDFITSSIATVYQHNIYPFWWKIPAMNSKDAWQQVTKVISQYDKQAAIIILGGAAKQIIDYQSVFALAQHSSLVTGFAIGRSIFWDVWLDFVEGKVNSSEISSTISDRYITLINYWNTTGGQQNEHTRTITQATT